MFDVVSSEGLVLLPGRHKRVFYHSGDFGDIIYALPVIRAFGGGELVIGPSKLWPTRLQMNKSHVDLMRPLLKLQPYITRVTYADGPPKKLDFDLNQFREYLVMEKELLRRGHRRLNLAEAHLYTFKLPLGECDRPWLTVDQPEPIPNRPVLIHRSARWRNHDFPWDKIMRYHAHHAAFVGLPSEYEDFVRDWGYLPYHPTADFLELARAISGCRLYIGNQSLPYAICEGLKHFSVLEVWQEGPNCLFNRENAVYGHGPNVYVPKIRDTDQMNTVLSNCPICGADASAAEPCRKNVDIVKCQACALIYLRTHPDREQTLLYYQKYADDHSHMHLPKNVDEIRTTGLRREYFMQEMLEFKKAGGTLLDIGCGWGAFLANARDKGFRPVGVDICHKAADFGTSVLGIPITWGDLSELTLPPESVSVVTAIHTLEHLDDTAAALARILQVLEPGGLFCGIVPNINSLCSTTFKEKWQWLDVNTHYVHFSPDTLKAILEKGFQIERIYTHTGDYDQVQLHKLLTERTGRPLEGDDLTETLQAVWDSGQGEEIRFFVRKL